MHIRSNLPILALLCAMACSPGTAWSWGGRQHLDINKAAARNVPEEMAAWRAYDKVLAFPGIYPDLWKGDDPDEGPRHYIDLESYADLGASRLPRDRTTMAANGSHPRDGIAPWVILELQTRLTAAMATGSWTEAACVAAAMGHYVGYTHQPLHTTENYDGAMTANHGVHMRWESRMPKAYWRYDMMTVTNGVYLDDPWPVILEWVSDSHDQYKAILLADRVALDSAGGNEASSAYLRRLWDETGEMFADQMGQSAVHLASLWYTAWVDAGRPEIPPPPAELPEKSIWAKRPDRKPPSAIPFFIGFIVITLIVLGLSIRKKGPASV